MKDMGSYAFIALLVSLLSLASDSFGLSSPVSPSLSLVFWDGGAPSHSSPTPIISIALHLLTFAKGQNLFALIVICLQVFVLGIKLMF